MYSVAVILFGIVAIVTSATVRNGLKSSVAEDTGSLSTEQQNTLGNFQYIGKINNKEFYYVFGWECRQDAAARCALAGTKLAKFETTEEIIFVQEHAPGSTAWVGGSIKFMHSDGTIIDSTIIEDSFYDDPINVGFIMWDFRQQLEWEILEYGQHNFMCSHVPSS